MLAKKPKAPLGIWLYALSFTTIASELAPIRENGSAVILFAPFSDVALEWQHSAGDPRSLIRPKKRNGRGHGADADC